MSFSENFFGPHRWQHFNFYAKGSAVTSAINEDVNISAPWKLAEVRLHFSTAMGSDKYMTIAVSAGMGSSYNTLLLSQNLLSVQDLFLHYSEPLLFMSDDQLIIRSSVFSVADEYGLQIIGWAVID